MVNQVTIEQLRDEIKEHAQDCEVHVHIQSCHVLQICVYAIMHVVV